MLLAITAMMMLTTQAFAGGIIQEMRTTSNAFTGITGPCATASAPKVRKHGVGLDHSGNCATQDQRPRVSRSTTIASNDTVSWNAFRYDGRKAKSYKVVRKCADDSDWETIATVKGDVFAFTDPNADDKSSCSYNVIGVYDSSKGEQQYNFQEQRVIDNNHTADTDVPQQGMACQTVNSRTPALWFLLLLPLLFVSRRRSHG
jgi:hypothetical protein